MSHFARLLILLVVLTMLFSITPLALAAANNTTYKPSHWSGWVHKFDAAGDPIGWKWGGGLRETGEGLVWAVNIYGERRNYMVEVGACYGCVQ